MSTHDAVVEYCFEYSYSVQKSTAYSTQDVAREVHFAFTFSAQPACIPAPEECKVYLCEI